MPALNRKPLDWQDLTLTAECQAAYDLIGQARQEYETLAAAALAADGAIPEGMVPKFGYGFGRPSVAFMPAKGPKGKIVLGKGAPVDNSPEARAARVAAYLASQGKGEAK